MGFMSFVIGGVIGAVAMKLYMDSEKEKYEETPVPVQTKPTVQKEDSPSKNIEITTEGSIEINPSDEDIILAAIKSLTKSKTRVSIAAVVRESGLSKYKVTKHKDLIEKMKSKK